MPPQVILYEEMVLNRPVLAQKLQGVGFSKEEVRKSRARAPLACWGAFFSFLS